MSSIQRRWMCKKWGRLPNHLQTDIEIKTKIASDASHFGLKTRHNDDAFAFKSHKSSFANRFFCSICFALCQWQSRRRKKTIGFWCACGRIKLFIPCEFYLISTFYSWLSFKHFFRECGSTIATSAFFSSLIASSCPLPKKKVETKSLFTCVWCKILISFYIRCCRTFAFAWALPKKSFRFAHLISCTRNYVHRKKWNSILIQTFDLLVWDW